MLATPVTTLDNLEEIVNKLLDRSLTESDIRTGLFAVAVVLFIAKWSPNCTALASVMTNTQNMGTFIGLLGPLLMSYCNNVCNVLATNILITGVVSCYFRTEPNNNPGDWWMNLERDPSSGSNTQIHQPMLRGHELTSSLLQLEMAQGLNRGRLCV